MGRPKGSRNGVRTLLHYTCERCDAPFTRRPSDESPRFCSMACYKPKREPVRCETCGTAYAPHASERGRYCSNVCKRRRIVKACPHCGRDFEVMVSKAAKYRYCSMACKRDARPLVTCEACGASFFSSAAQAVARRFCSRDCLADAHRATIVCAYCGASRTIKRYRAEEGQRCCSNRCATLLRMRELSFEPAYIAEKRRSGRRTDIETLAEAVLREVGLPYQFELKVGRYSIDFALPTLGIALECDGWQHLTTAGRARDARRDAELAAAGWRAVHVDGGALRRDARVAIRHALRDAGVDHLHQPPEDGLQGVRESG